MENQKVEISLKSVLKIILVFLGLGFLYLVREILLLLFISVLIAASIDPVVDYLQRKKIPRSVGALFIYLVLFLAIALIFSFVFPPLVSQLKDFSKNSAQYINAAQNGWESPEGIFSVQAMSAAIGSVISGFGESLSSLSKDVFSKTVGVFSGLISTIVVFSLAFYMVMVEDGMRKFVVSIVPEKNKAYASHLTERIKKKIGQWMGGQLILMLAIFVLDFVGLYLIGIPYALVLAVLAGLLEIVPYAGPIIAAVPGVILGFLISPTTGFFALLVYSISQQIEAHVVVPQVMRRAVGLNPVATIMAILIGFKLAGVLGAIISVPVATAVSLFLADMLEKEEK